MNDLSRTNVQVAHVCRKQLNSLRTDGDTKGMTIHWKALEIHEVIYKVLRIKP
jgi:hypothetical protein